MSLSSADDAKERVRQATEIVDLVGGYLELRRQGRLFVAHCPWHDDSRPSLQVNPQRQSWRCWVCNIGGDIYDFVMRREGVDFREALTMLAERAGIELASQRSGGGSAGNEKARLYEVTAWAERQFAQCLSRDALAEPARRYLAERGIEPVSIERFRLGFSPDQWQWLVDRASGASFTTQELVHAGLSGVSNKSGRPYDFFKGRLIFPIHDWQGRPVAFGGRILPELADEKAAKYKNTAETRLFSKSDQLYGLDVARDSLMKQRHAVVVEGYTDVIMAHQHGVQNVVAVLGTALGPRHVKLLKRFADRITLVLDGDEAGQRRTNEVLELFVAQQVDLRVAVLPEQLDPCDFLQTRGAEAFQDLVEDAADALNYKIDIATRGIDVTRDTHAATVAIEDVLRVLASAPRLGAETGQTSHLRTQQVISRLARTFQLPEEEIRARLTALRRSRPAPRESRLDDTGPQAPPPGSADLPAVERELLETALQSPEALPYIAEAAEPDAWESAPAATLLRALLAGLDSAGQLNFNKALDALDDANLRCLLVDLDERAQQKPSEACEARIKELLREIELRRIDREWRAQRTRLEQGGLDDEQELNLLIQVHELDKRRQKLLELLRSADANRPDVSAPTEG